MATSSDTPVVVGEPPSVFPQRFQWTREAYMQFGSVNLFGFRRRPPLIRGELWDLGPMSPLHAAGIQLADRVLFSVFTEGFLLSCQCPLDLGPETMPLPDRVILKSCWGEFIDRHPKASEAVLVVEVADNTQEFDLGLKAELYAIAGVPDYWVVDVLNSRVHVFREPSSTYRSHRVLTADESMSPLAAPDRTVKVADLLP
jgi:hypothetical protein